MKKIILYIIALFGTQFLFSQVQTKVDTTRIRIGEQISYEISIDQKVQVVFPSLILDSLKKVEVVREFPIDTLKNRLYKRYLLTSFDSGDYVIPAQEVFIDNQRFLSDSILIHVGTVEVDTTKQGLFPIKPIYKAPHKTWHEYLYLLWWILGILALIALIWWLAFRSKKVIQFKPKVILTPFDIALNQLKSLDEKNLIGQLKIKEYYTELTEIVRNYIEQDVKISAMEITSDELIAHLKEQNKHLKLGISKAKINHLQLFLQNADLVKFAKAKPEAEQIKEDRNFAETVLKELKSVISKPQLDENGNPIIELEKEEIKLKTSKKRRWIGVGAGIALLLFVAGGFTWYYGFQYVKDSVIGHPSKELLEGKWYGNTYGYPSIYIESPVILKAVEVPYPPELTQLMISNSSFGYGSIISGFYVMIMTSEGYPEFEFNIDEAVQGSVQMIQSQPGITDLKYDVEDIETSGISGKKITGTLKANKVDMKYLHFIFNKANGVQQLIIARKPSDTYAEKIEKRMVESIKLESISE
jgi:hypothetical protein